MSGYLPKLFFGFFFLFILFLLFATSSLAQQYGSYYNIYSPAMAGVKDANSCYYPPPEPCSATFFDGNCTLKPECVGHHCANSKNGYDCASQWGGVTATCLNTNYVYPNGPDYSSICGGGIQRWYGFQFVIPAPCGLVAQSKQTCNSTGTAWITTPDTSCVALSSCTDPTLTCSNPTCASLGGTCTGSPPGCTGGAPIIPGSSNCSSGSQVCCGPAQQCTVTLPASQTIAMGTTGTITPSITGSNGAGITQVNFSSSSPSIATVNPASTSTSPYSTAINPFAIGTTTITATATLSDGRTCSSNAGVNTVVTVVPPTNSYVTIQGHYVDQNGIMDGLAKAIARRELMARC